MRLLSINESSTWTNWSPACRRPSLWVSTVLNVQAGVKVCRLMSQRIHRNCISSLCLIQYKCVFLQPSCQSWQWNTIGPGHGSNGSPKLDGSHGSWVSGVNPIILKYFYFYSYSYVICANCCLCWILIVMHPSIDWQICAEIIIIKGVSYYLWLQLLQHNISQI
jgi:hypothetical protein